MKIKRMILRILLLGCLLMTSLGWGGAVLAQDEELPDPGMTPDSPFYFLDEWGKGLSLAFTFGDEAKAQKALQYAGERLAEARQMAAANRTREMTRAAAAYEGFMNRVNERVQAAGDGGGVSERVALAAANHLAVLDEIKDSIPEEGAEAVNRARQASRQGQENALRTLAENNPGRALEINADAIENRLKRARVMATENISAEVRAALDDAEILADIEEDISETAAARNIDIEAVRQRLAQSTSNRLEVLAEIYEQVPEDVKTAVANALENSVRNYERAIERTSGNGTSEAALSLERVRAEIEERIRVMTSSEVQASGNASDNGTQSRVQTQTEIEERERVSQTDEATDENGGGGAGAAASPGQSEGSESGQPAASDTGKKKSP